MLPVYCAAAGVKRLSPHGLRHTFATVALESGTHPKIVSEWLGHTNIAMTFDTYSHAMPSHSAAESEWVGAVLFD